MAHVEITNVNKSYGSYSVIEALDLAIADEEFVVLVGPSGCGKTTTLRMVAGLLKPDAGDIRVFGIDARAKPVLAKRLIAWVPDEPMLYDKLTPVEYLEFVAGLWGVKPKIAADRARELDRTSGV